MTKDVKVTIRGLHVGANNDDLKNVHRGKYSEKDGTIYVMYDETDEDGKVTSNMVKIAGDTFELRKKGVASLTTILEKGRIHKTNYVTPFGTFALEFNTKKCHINCHDTGVYVKIEYALAINEEHSSDCKLTFEAMWDQ